MAVAALAIDPGTRTGVAFRRRDGTVLWRTWDLHGDLHVRLDQLFRRLSVLHAAERFEQLAFEQPFVGANPQAAMTLLPMAGVIQVWASLNGLVPVGFQPTEIKAAVAGARANKEAVAAAVRQRGYAVATEHEADAVACLVRLEDGRPPRREVNRAAARRQRSMPLPAGRRGGR